MGSGYNLYVSNYRNYHPELEGKYFIQKAAQSWNSLSKGDKESWNIEASKTHTERKPRKANGPKRALTARNMYVSEVMKHGKNVKIGDAVTYFDELTPAQQDKYQKMADRVNREEGRGKYA